MHDVCSHPSPPGSKISGAPRSTKSWDALVDKAREAIKPRDPELR